MSYLDIAFENYGTFYVTFVSTHGSTVTFSGKNGMKDCIEFIEYHMNHDTRIAIAYICDSETGEIVATIERKDR